MSDTPQLLALMQKTREMKAYDCVKEFESLARKLEKENIALRDALVLIANGAKSEKGIAKVALGKEAQP
jgi:exonuclease VII small subunit